MPQIVLLGSGYDTRAIRHHKQNQSSIAFELDTPALLKNKQVILNRNDIKIPDRLKLYPIVFGKDDFAAALETLSFIKDNSPVGSTLAFDYFYQSAIDGNHDYYGAKGIAAAVQEVGELFQFGIEPDNLTSFLADFDFELLSHYISDNLEQTYPSSHGEQLDKVYGFAACVMAVRT